MRNIDKHTVDSLVDEWSRFEHPLMTDSEARKVFDEYFAVFRRDTLPPDAVGFDMGCGSGRWARRVTPRVGRLHCIDRSEAIDVTRANLAEYTSIRFHEASVDKPELPPDSLDFGYFLAVLHQVSDTATAVRSCVALLKLGAPLLFYLYCAFDNLTCCFRHCGRFLTGGSEGFTVCHRFKACGY